MSCTDSSRGAVIQRAAIPMPVQVVIDDVGWWCGEDGHDRGEPFRTGIDRNHVPADYEAIVRLGQALNMRPQAAFILCEWDRDNILRELPSSTWMGAAWDNPQRTGPWHEEAADIVRRNKDHLELTLHGLGHERWQEGRMERAEWHDTDGRMRPADEVRKRLELYARILDQHGLGPFPDSYVPTAFLHRFGAEDGGLATILAETGVTFISTPFAGMHRDREPEYPLFGMDGGVMTADRGHDLCPWYAIEPELAGALEGPICGMHWPNLLHSNPERNSEIVDRWVGLLKPYGRGVDTTLARDAKTFATQLVYHTCAQVRVEPEGLVLDLSGLTAVRERMSVDEALEVRFSAPTPCVATPCAATAAGVQVEADTPVPCDEGFLHTIRISGTASRDLFRLKVRNRQP
ncbi:MAG: hypothetical protein GY851_02665 [bacterium]|nr:hypothetical protein [bacterium]